MSTSNPSNPPNTKPVPSSHQFNEQSLATWLHSHVPGYTLAEANGPLHVLQFTHGQSNPTFLLTVGSGNKLKRYVLRKKPGGKLLPSAHAIEREYRVLSALRSSRVPVPRTYALCEDSSVIGTPFYIMQYVEGRIFQDVSLPNMKPSQRFAIYASMNKVLAHIHAIDINAIGLSDFGKSENYIERNVKRWSDQYEKSKTGDVPEVCNCHVWMHLF
jgi:aminoglycoside phosphotransferase (APT) family kinase protein